MAGHRHHPANCALQLLRRGAHGPRCLNRPPAWKLPRVGVYGHLCKISDGSSVPLCVFFPLGSELRRESDDGFEATAEKARPTQDLRRGCRSPDRQGSCSQFWMSLAGDSVFKNNSAFLRSGQDFIDKGRPSTAHGAATKARSVACTRVLGQVPGEGVDTSLSSDSTEPWRLSGTSARPGPESPPPAGICFPVA